MGRFSVGSFILTALWVYKWLVVIRCILSFIPHNPYQPIIKFIYDVTEPLMAPFRRLLPGAGGVDFSPMLLFLVIYFLERVVAAYL
ncbi:MAG: YggT family protein [Syntrophomonas sp.]